MKEGVVLDSKNIEIPKLKETCDDISDNFEFLQCLMTQNLRYQLALEDYTDDTQEEIKFLNETWKRQGLLRKNRDNWSLEKQIQEAKIIQENFQKIVQEIGHEHFIFYDDGDINSIWQNIKKEEKNE